jgi:hypothetical protein
MIDPEAFGDSPRAPADWARIVVEFVRESGWTFDQAAELTLGQLGAWKSKGQSADLDVPPRPGETSGQAAERRAAYFDLDGEARADG